MRFAAAVSVFLSLAACVWAAEITVKVGDGGIVFSPESVTANQGDIISFQFLAGNHSVTQSSFNDPCTKLTTPTTGIDSDYQPVAANSGTIPQWSFTVDNATAPLWFYCKQAGHCKGGMVFAVNPSADKTFDAFKAKATGASPSTPSSSSAGPVPTPSATNTPANGAALGFDSSKLAGIIALVAIFAGSIL